MTNRRRPAVFLMTALIAGSALVGCAKDDGAATRSCGGASGSAAGSASGVASSGGTPLVVTTKEWLIQAPATAKAGKTLLTVQNEGEKTHEVVVIKGIKPQDLPTNADGELDESALPDGALLGEVDGVTGGSTCDGTIELTAGDYSLVCNLVDDETGKKVSHQAKGMVTELKVT